MSAQINLQSKFAFPAEVIRHVQSPIDDLLPNQNGEVEAELRRNFAACFRLIDLFGWSQLIHNHLTARIPGTQEVLFHPFGLSFHEVTASSLIKVDLNSKNVIDQGSTKLGINPSGWVLHSSVMKARPDINCCFHIHLPEIMAISALDRPFINLHQETQCCGEVPIHEFSGILLDTEECSSIAQDLGPESMLMLLRNHGIVACGETIYEAFFYLTTVAYGLTAQANILHVPLEKWCLSSPESMERTMKGARGEEKGELSGIHWEMGELGWQAWMRALDRMGLKTGYIPRMAVWRNSENLK